MLPSTIAAPVETELIIKRSQFLTHLAPVTTMASADEVIAQIRKTHWNANHNCVALILGTTGDSARSSDDGEPSGTAGIPMLEVLRNRQITDVVAVVTRYFGGVLLGAGGLVRAYSNAVSEALNQAEIVQRRLLAEVSIEVSHADAGKIDNWLRDWTKNHDAVFTEVEYRIKATLKALVAESELPTLKTDLAAISAGALTPNVGSTRVADIK